MRRLTRSLFIALLLAIMPGATITAVTPSTAPGSEAALTRLKTKGTAEIERRKDSLQVAWQRLTDSKNLTAADKEVLVTLVNKQLADLEALKNKLNAETTVTAARADVASIVTGYRVYTLTLPKARMVASADRFTVAQTKLTELYNKLAPKVGDNAELKPRLQQMQEHITASATFSIGVIPPLLALTPAEYNANPSILVKHRAALKAAHDSLKQARQDAQFIIDELKPHTH